MPTAKLDEVNNPFSLLRLVPQITRARDFRLYTKDGRRLVDLWQNGGAAVLGHTPPSVLQEIKNTANRGLFAPLPHFSEDRLLKALAQLLPGSNFRLYAAAPPQLEKMLREGTAAIWRPFLNFALPADNVAAASSAKPSAAILILPGIQSWRDTLPLGLCVCAVNADVDLPPSDMLPPVLLAAAARGVHDLIAAIPTRANVQYPRINKVLQNSSWQRKGIYLFLNSEKSGGGTSHSDWSALFKRFLDAGFLLPPTPQHPLILPGVLSPGEEAKLAEVLAGKIGKQRLYSLLETGLNDIQSGNTLSEEEIDKSIDLM